MRTLQLFLREHRALWRIWIVLILFSAVLPLLAVALPLIQRQLIDGVILQGRLDRLPATSAAFAGVWLLSAVILVVAGLLNTLLRERLALALRARLFAQSSRLSIDFSEQQHTGKTVSLFLNDVPVVTSLFTDTAVTTLGNVITLAVSVVVMFRLNPQLALAAALGPPVVTVLAAFATRPLRPAARRAQEKAAELTQRLQENLSGMREVVAFGRERTQGVLFGSALRDLLRLQMRISMIQSGIGLGASLFSLAVSLTVFIYGGYLVIEGQTSLGTVFAMQALFGLVFQPAGQLVRVVGDVQKALGAADRVYDYLNEEPGVPEYEDAVELVSSNGDVTFVDVSFSYLPGVTVLSDISFSARSGETIALVGPSGAGKSTLASLIPRFHDPDSGAVLLDGTDLRDLTLDSLRQQIGIVFQDTYLFAASIRDNIAFGYEDATEDEIVRAAAAANVLEFVQRLPAGFDTWVGERGVQLSEGQKQRIAIARALLREPRILILDEPTAALDARSESLLQAALDAATRGRTTFVIAHRLATVLRADLILVLDGGCIVQQGTHHALMAAGGLYRDLYDLQFSPAVEQGDSDSARTGVLAVTPGG